MVRFTCSRLGLKQEADERCQEEDFVAGCSSTPSRARHLRRPAPGAPRFFCLRAFRWFRDYYFFLSLRSSRDSSSFKFYKKRHFSSVSSYFTFHLTNRTTRYLFYRLAVAESNRCLNQSFFTGLWTREASGQKSGKRFFSNPRVFGACNKIATWCTKFATK